MAYVYRHIRLDKNIPFYIGIGSDSRYLRANTDRGRSKYWRRIVAKAGYEVEIMFDDLSWEDACRKEKEFISLYGRWDLKEGPLCNCTSGGDGAIGLPYETREFIKDFTRKKVTQYSKDGKFVKTHKSIADAAREIKLSENSVRLCVKGKNKTAGGFIYRIYDGNTDHINLDDFVFNNTVVKINQYSQTGFYIKTFSSIADASRELNIPSSGIWQSVNISCFSGGFLFKRYNDSICDIDTSGHFVNKCFKKVDRFDLNGKYIDSFNSLKKAEDLTRINRAYISACCTGQQNTAGGFIWKHSNKIP